MEKLLPLRVFWGHYMKYLIQFLIILAFSFAGELLRFIIPLPIPASIYGIVLLFSALKLKIVKASHIRETADFLILIMPILYLPPAEGVMESWGLIKANWLPYIAVTVISTVTVMAVSGAITQKVIRRKTR